MWALRELSWLTHGIFLQTWCSFSLSYSVQLKSEDCTICGNSKFCKPHYGAGPIVMLTWQGIITFTDKETCMHACSYSDTVISEKTKKNWNLYLFNCLDTDLKQIACVSPCSIIFSSRLNNFKHKLFILFLKFASNVSHLEELMCYDCRFYLYCNCIRR